MRKGRSLLVFCLLTAVVSVVVISEKPQSKATVIQTGQAASPSVAMPEHVPYMFLFHHLSFLNQKAAELDKKGKGKSTLLLRFRQDAGLSDAQFQQLLQVALDCERQIAEEDKKAEAIINSVKARYPEGRIPEGQAPPPLPPELLTMQQERDAAVLRPRDRVRTALGEKAFADLDAFVQSHIAPKVERVSPQ